MTLFSALHAKWSAVGALATAVPPARVYSGTVPQQTPLPFANLIPLSESPHDYTATGDVLATRVIRLGVRADGLAEADRLRRLMDAAFDGQPLSIEGATVLSITRIGGGHVEEPDGVWHCYSDFEVLEHRPP